MYCYATSVSDGSATRGRIEGEADVFRDLHDLSDAQMAFAINADGVHVLVDMNGHTLGPTRCARLKHERERETLWQTKAYAASTRCEHTLRPLCRTKVYAVTRQTKAYT